MNILWVCFFGTLFFAQTGLLTVEWSWKTAIERQWKVDQELGRSMIHFRNLMNAIESSNTRMKAIRVSIMAASLTQPELVDGLKQALNIEAFFQRKRLWEWKTVRLKTALNHELLPALPWSEVLPDGIGPQALQWDRIQTDLDSFQGWKKNRNREAWIHVYKHKDGKWHSRFGRPLGSRSDFI